MTARAHRAGELAVSRKLSHYAPLSADDIQELESVVGERVDQFGPRDDVIREGEKPDSCTVLISGWACRYKMLEDGRRQIMALLLPGDVCDYGSFMLSRLDHSIGALGPLTCGRIPQKRFEALTRNRPLLSRAFLLDTLAVLSVQREWTVNLGQRDAYERMAHFFCELFVRLRAVGLTNGDQCDCPLTQADLGDALGISSIHVNRIIQELRRHNLVDMASRTLTIPNLRALEIAGLFSPDYLHFDAG